jgi:predicted RNA-binding Zn-ribbon protein involved in translation (DUF1610 family)
MVDLDGRRRNPAMKITFSCSGCGKTLKAPPNDAGRTRKCPVCATRVTCPARSAAPRKAAARLSNVNADADVVEAEVVAIIPDAAAARVRSQPSPPATAAPPAPAIGPFDDLDDDPYQLAEPDPLSTAGPEPKKPCPICGETILQSAVKCRYCGEVLDSRLKDPKSRKKKKKKATSSASRGSTTFRDLGIGVIVLALGVGLTAYSYANPATDSQGQGKFYIFHGFIIGGLAQTCKGLYDLIRGE